MAPCAQEVSGVFRGDGEQMLAALIAACEAKPVSQKADPAWFGRVLEPWCDDSMPAQSSMSYEALEAGSRRMQAGSKFPANSHKHGRPGRAPESPQHKRAQTKRSKGGSPPRAATPPVNACACPALAASPKPEALPMPTTVLMSRALARSPSPPKDAAVASWFAYNQAQLLVRPVAA